MSSGKDSEFEGDVGARVKHTLFRMERTDFEYGHPVRTREMTREEILAQPCVAAYIDRLQGAWILGDGDAKGAYRTFEDVGVRRLPERTLSDEERRWYDSAVAVVVDRLAYTKHAHEDGYRLGRAEAFSESVKRVAEAEKRGAAEEAKGLVLRAYRDGVWTFMLTAAPDTRWVVYRDGAWDRTGYGDHADVLVLKAGTELSVVGASKVTLFHHAGNEP